MNTTKIEWCDCTINPVMGCPRGCPYCYARKMNTRYKWIEDFSKPQFFPDRLNAFKSKKPKAIFMNSMSDYMLWSSEQIKAVYEAIKANAQHKYIFLTKEDGLCSSFTASTENKEWRNNCFYGHTITAPKHIPYCDFLSIEPLHAPLNQVFEQFNKVRYAVIIGAETGNRKGKIIPRKEWVDDIVRAADERGLSVFMKNSLRPIMGDDFRQDKLPWRD